MNKETMLRRYVNLNIVVGLVFLLLVFLFVLGFVGQVNGIVEKNLFEITVENFFGDLENFNTPIIVFFVFLLFNIGFYVLLGRSDDVTQKELKEVALINALLTLVMVLGQVLFVIQIPSQIQGSVADKLIFVEMPYTASQMVRVFNINYVMSLLYVGYNMYVTIKTLPPKEEGTDEVDEEVLEEVLYQRFTSKD